MRRSCIGLLVSSFLAAPALQASAERLPVRAYTTADGLGHDRVFCVVQDSRGLLWFCTIDGVSRFDGHRFVNYGEAQGLPAAPAYAFIESRPGVYWVGTHGGLARLDAMVTSSSPGKTPFVEHPLGVDAPRRPILSFLRDRAGRVWAGGEAGLFLIDDEGNDANVRITPVSVAGVDWNSIGRIRAILEDHEGGLWLAADRAIVRRLSDGRVALYAMQTGGRLLKARGLLEVEPGTLWIGTADGLIVLRPELERSARGVDAHAFATARPCPLRPDEPRPSVCEYGTAIGNAGTLIRSLFRTPDGTIWIGAVNGITSFDGARFRTFDKANGLTNETINAIALDRAGSLWLGTDLGGVLRIAQGVMTTYALADGLMASDVSQVVEDPTGRLYAVTLRRGLVHRFDGRRFHLVDLHLSPTRGADRPAPGRRHDLPRWWLENGTSKTLLAEPFDDNQKHVFAVFPDSRGDVWIGEHAADHDTLARWRHETQTLQRFEPGADEPRFDTGDTFDSTLSFAEDAHGSVWIGVVDGGLARFRDDRFVWVRDSAGAPLRNVKSVAADHQGVVWIAAADGIYRVLDPLATKPRAAKIVPASAVGRIKCMTVDNAGRIYIGTPNGVEQVDPHAGRIARRYTKADGLAHNEILSAFRDRFGSLWFGTYEGVSRFVPTLEAPEPTPPAFVSAVVVAGRRLMIAELGAARVDGLELAPDERQIQIEFGGLPFGLGDPLRFQYRLVGADDNWTPPDETRITSYAQLGRGAYRFEVRAVTASGRRQRGPGRCRVSRTVPGVGPMVVHRNTRRHGRPRGACHLSDAHRATGGAGAHPYANRGGSAR